jgi:hypothetical protein
LSQFITLPHATRGYWNVGTGTGDGKLIERLAGTLEGTVEIDGSIQIVNVLSGVFTPKTTIRGRIIDIETLGGTLDV